jgi:hypothetical protein
MANEMKPCFGRELGARFSPGTAPIGIDANASRKECYTCPDFDRCAKVIAIVQQHRAK